MLNNILNETVFSFLYIAVISAPFFNNVLHKIVVFTISCRPKENKGKNKLIPSFVITLTSAPLFIKKLVIL